MHAKFIKWVVYVAQLTPEFCEQQDCHWSPTFPVDLQPTETDYGPMLPYRQQGMHSITETFTKAHNIKKLNQCFYVLYSV